MNPQKEEPQTSQVSNFDPNLMPQPKRSLIGRIIKGILLVGALSILGVMLYFFFGFKGFADTCNARTARLNQASEKIRLNLSKIVISDSKASSVKISSNGDCVTNHGDIFGSVEFVITGMTVDQVTKVVTTALQPQNDLNQLSRVSFLHVPEIVSGTTVKSYTVDKTSFNSIDVRSNISGSLDYYSIDYSLDRTISCIAITGSICDEGIQTAIASYRLGNIPVQKITIGQYTFVK